MSLPIFIATSNRGKLRDFAAAASLMEIEVRELPNLASLPQPEEPGSSFEANARLKAEFYSRHAPGALVLADDSGLEVPALNGAPGVLSARYAAEEATAPADNDSLLADEANNRRLLRELAGVAPEQRAAQFVCVLAAAQDGKVLQAFRGEVRGTILEAPRGHNGFGYDPLFFVPELRKTTAEMSPGEKSAISHRGQAFRKFLDWYRASSHH
jgi:XTP/dITP diphosphohydrolase